MRSSLLQSHKLDEITSEGLQESPSVQKQIIAIEMVKWNPCYEAEVLHK